jgi:hypothetical protein
MFVCFFELNKQRLLKMLPSKMQETPAAVRVVPFYGT